MTLTATIDTGACAAHGDCEAIAPEIFSIDDVAVVVGTARTSSCSPPRKRARRSRSP